LRVVMLSSTPLAGAPYETVRCLRKYSSYFDDIHLIQWKNKYTDGRVFPSEILYPQDEDYCDRLISQADVVHVNNPPFSRPLKFNFSRVLWQFHSVPLRTSFHSYLSRFHFCYTIMQPLHQRVYRLFPFPNLMDPEEYKPLKHSLPSKPRIVFAPTNRFPATTPGTKCAEQVAEILRSFESRFEIDIFNNLPYVQNLERKRRADIIIDDVVNKTFHKTTLEASCFGTCVITSWDNGHFCYADLKSLPKVLDFLAKNSSEIVRYKRLSRRWILNRYHPAKLVKLCEFAYQRVLGGCI